MVKEDIEGLRYESSVGLMVDDYKGHLFRKIHVEELISKVEFLEGRTGEVPRLKLASEWFDEWEIENFISENKNNLKVIIYDENKKSRYGEGYTFKPKNIRFFDGEIHINYTQTLSLRDSESISDIINGESRNGFGEENLVNVTKL